MAVDEDGFIALIDGLVGGRPLMRVFGTSYFLVIFAPLRAFEISFYCGPK